MSYPANQEAQLAYRAPVPPAPPPKPPQELSTPPPVPPHPSQQQNQSFLPSQSSPTQHFIPPRHSSLHAAGQNDQSHSMTGNSHWTSTWRAPYPPDEGLHRSTLEEVLGQQRQHSYAQQYHEHQARESWKGSAERQVYEADSGAQHNPLERPNQLGRQQSYQAQQHQEQYQLPANLESKTITDLSTLLADPQLLTAIIHASETQPASMQNSTAQLNSYLAANMELAKTLSTLHETLCNTRATTSSNLLRIRGLETAWKKKQAELEHKLEPWGARELHQRLGAAIAEGDGMCAALEASFIDAANGAGGTVADEREVTEWVRRVREGRRSVALRRERKRRWDEGRVGGWR